MAIAKVFRLGLLMPALALTISCGSGNHCQLIALSVSPSSATADHSAVAPGNQVRFFAQGQVPASCAVVQCVNCYGQKWSVSDPVNVSISNNASDNGTATCLAATNGAATVMAVAPAGQGTTQTVSGTASLTCR